MKVIDAGHTYKVDSYDGGEDLTITFMKREGDRFPGNVGHYPGTNCQELLRVLIDRTRYLDNQHHHENNSAVIRHLQSCLWLFEDRAAEIHNIDQFDFRFEDIELETACPTCGHITCRGH